MAAYCAWCGDRYDPVEYATVDFEGPNFCSDDCTEAWDQAVDAEENEEAYNEGRYGACPVFP